MDNPNQTELNTLMTENAALWQGLEKLKLELEISSLEKEIDKTTTSNGKSQQTSTPKPALKSQARTNIPNERPDDNSQQPTLVREERPEKQLPVQHDSTHDRQAKSGTSAITKSCHVKPGTYDGTGTWLRLQGTF